VLLDVIEAWPSLARAGDRSQPQSRLHASVDDDDSGRRFDRAAQQEEPFQPDILFEVEPDADARQRETRSQTADQDPDESRPLEMMCHDTLQDHPPAPAQAAHGH
jgi:hypothetical protein